MFLICELVLNLQRHFLGAVGKKWSKYHIWGTKNGQTAFSCTLEGEKSESEMSAEFIPARSSRGICCVSLLLSWYSLACSYMITSVSSQKCLLPFCAQYGHSNSVRFLPSSY